MCFFFELLCSLLLYVKFRFSRFWIIPIFAKLPGFVNSGEVQVLMKISGKAWILKTGTFLSNNVSLYICCSKLFSLFFFSFMLCP